MWRFGGNISKVNKISITLLYLSFTLSIYNIVQELEEVHEVSHKHIQCCHFPLEIVLITLDAIHDINDVLNLVVVVLDGASNIVIDFVEPHLVIGYGF